MLFWYFCFWQVHFFHLLIKPKPDVRVKIIPLAIFFFVGYSLEYFQCPTSHRDINVCSQLPFFAFELIKKFGSLYISVIFTINLLISAKNDWLKVTESVTFTQKIWIRSICRSFRISDCYKTTAYSSKFWFLRCF